MGILSQYGLPLYTIPILLSRLFFFSEASFCPGFFCALFRRCRCCRSTGSGSHSGSGSGSGSGSAEFAELCRHLPFFAFLCRRKILPQYQVPHPAYRRHEKAPSDEGAGFCQAKGWGERSRFLSGLLPPKSYPVKALHDRRNAFTVPGSDPSYTAPGRWLPDPTAPWQVPCPHSDNARVQR